MKKKKIRDFIAKARATGEHGPSARVQVHKSKKKYDRKDKNWKKDL